MMERESSHHDAGIIDQNVDVRKLGLCVLGKLLDRFGLRRVDNHHLAQQIEIHRTYKAQRRGARSPEAHQTQEASRIGTTNATDTAKRLDSKGALSATNLDLAEGLVI